MMAAELKKREKLIKVKKNDLYYIRSYIVSSFFYIFNFSCDCCGYIFYSTLAYTVSDTL